MSELKEKPPSTLVALLKMVIFTVLVPGSVTFWLPRWIYRSTFQWSAIERGSTASVGTLLIALGIAGYLWCALDFAFRGRGTPAPIDPPKVLVVRGLYGYVRNPMYVSVLTVLLGESVLLHSWALARYAGICFLGFFVFVLAYEEPALREKFGDSYREYCRTVPRWLPRLQKRV
jgi:protein-S-isoprenylcysteine O-methyltransferase Ste14